MSEICILVEQELVSGHALSDAHATHLESCESCSSLDRLGQSLSAIMTKSSAAAVPMGFATRLAAEGHARIARRRRRRIGWTTAGGLASVAVLLVILRGSGPSSQDPSSSAATRAGEMYERPAATRMQGSRSDEDLSDEDLRLAEELLLLADVEASLRISADWERFESPLASIAIATELKP